MVVRCCLFEVYSISYCVYISAARVSSKDDVTDEEDQAETSLVLVEEHKSVILHLLSQLKLGMDLTKVVLPTFILEKRSLLEMFADCMGHPQLFVWSVSYFREADFWYIEFLSHLEKLIHIIFMLFILCIFL
jgi:hypothetical protein